MGQGFSDAFDCGKFFLEREQDFVDWDSYALFGGGNDSVDFRIGL